MAFSRSLMRWIENGRAIIFKALNVLATSKFDFMSSLIHMVDLCFANVNLQVLK